MFINWYNREGHKNSCEITSIDDIEKYEEKDLFYLRVRKDKVLHGGILGEFESEHTRDEAYNDIKDNLDVGAEELDFRPGFYLYK